jgi:hypothetical protein
VAGSVAVGQWAARQHGSGNGDSTRKVLFLPGGTVGYLAHPRLICSSVRLSSDITFNYSAENLLIPTIKATIETSWY